MARNSSWTHSSSAKTSFKSSTKRLRARRLGLPVPVLALLPPDWPLRLRLGTRRLRPLGNSGPRLPLRGVSARLAVQSEPPGECSTFQPNRGVLNRRLPGRGPLPRPNPLLDMISTKEASDTATLVRKSYRTLREVLLQTCRSEIGYSGRVNVRVVKRVRLCNKDCGS